MIAYRPDVDGLRAVAVISVVAYHAMPHVVPGGFIGVDVFFVISGYLITRLIAADIDRHRFSIAAFYVRRTKRIFPALFVVLFTTLALGLCLLTPGELRTLGRTMAATAGFASNIAFWQDTGYFDAAAESKPLLHTWSLAVEEQFYVLWPLTLLVVYRTRHARATIATLAVASFVASCYLTVRHQPSAFFLLPPRAWELLVGAALALGMVPRITSEVQRNTAAIAGIALIGVALIRLSPASPFPGWNAVAPCLGAALIIAAGETGGNVISVFWLARSPMVFGGLISYSLYLWHWPLLSLARITHRGQTPLTLALVVVAVAVFLSVITWKFVETPLRAKSNTPSAAPVLIRYALMSLAALTVGLGVYASNGLREYAAPEVLRAENARYDVNPRSEACLRWQSATGPLAMEECMAGDQSKRRLVVWGDSHADAIAPTFVTLGTDRDYAVHQLTMAGCPPLMGAELRGPGADYSPCVTFNQRVMEYVARDPAVEVVVLSARWTLYTENVRFGDDPGPITFLIDEKNQDLSSQSSHQVFGRALERTVASLRRAGRTVILVGTIPPLGINVPGCLARNQMPLSGTASCDAEARIVLSHLAPTERAIERVAASHDRVCTSFPSRVLCATGRCLATSGSSILYANDDHLSLEGARFLSKHLDFGLCLGGGAGVSRTGVGSSLLVQ